jgi:LysM repeat protein
LKTLLLSKLVLVLLFATVHVQAQSLKGSPTSINRQYNAARSYGLAFVDTGSSVRRYVDPGHLVRVNPDRYLELHDVSYPYAVPTTKTFLNRLSSQYYSACGEKLTVTSLLRPKDRQPANSVAKSVHPTGMAIDLRVPKKRSCRVWLEQVLLSLEGDRVLDVTRERRPPHYHVALFITNYEKRLGIESAPATGLAYAGPEGPGGKYTVQRGDTLSEIAKLTGVSVARLRTANGLGGNRIYAGQSLQLPGSSLPASQGLTNLASAETKRIGASQELTYRVNRGETLSEIAKVTGVSVARLRAANGLRGSRIYAGQKLDIPGGFGLAAGEEIIHKVNRGDTLWRIANLYGTSVAQLRRANQNAGDDLRVGQELRIIKG